MKLNCHYLKIMLAMSIKYILIKQVESHSQHENSLLSIMSLCVEASMSRPTSFRSSI